MRAFNSLATIVAVSTGVGAAYLSQPEPTKAVDMAKDGWTPKPTGHVELRELFRRQADEPTVLAAPDNTCGFISGRQGAAYTCGGGAILCALSIQNGEGAVACCNDLVCELRTECIDYAALSTGACDNGCLVDIQVVKCTNTAMAYCNTVTFGNGARDYWCNSLPISEPQTVFTTYRGGPARSYSRVTVDASTSLEIVTSGTIEADGGASISEDAPGATSSGGPSDDSSNDSSNDSNDDPDTKKKKDSGPPIGAIVGGVVGGVGAIGIAALAIVLFMRRKKKATAAAAAADTQQPPPMTQPPPPSSYNSGVPPGFNGYYNPSQSTSPGPQYPPQVPGAPGYYPNVPSTVSSPQTVYAQTGSSPVHGFNQQPGFPPPQQQQQPVVHEAGGDPVTAKTHELGS